MSRPLHSRHYLLGGLAAIAVAALGLWLATAPSGDDPELASIPGPLPARIAASPAVARPTPEPDAQGAEAYAEGAEAGPELERLFFDDWHGEEYGAVLPPEIQLQMRAEIDALPPAPGGLQSSDGWSLAGPSGMKAPGHNNLYSGRVLDLASRNTGSTLDIWVAAASGGLWHFNGYTGVYTPLTETLATQAVSTVSVDPANPLNIVIGTGEYGVRGGLGIFRSTDGGATWQTTNADAALTGEVHRIRHVTSTKLVCAASKALLRSGDGGATWTVVLGYRSFDVAVNPAHPDTVYTTVITSTQGQVRRSTDGGVTFPVTGAVGVPLCERGAVALCRSQPWVVYGAFANPDSLGFGLKGLVTTSNAGGTWYGVNLPDNYMAAQGWYNNVVAVDPDNPAHVLLGGTYLRETFNSGAAWLDHPSDMAEGLHPDYHAMEWLLASPATAGPAGGGGGVVQGGSAALMIGHDGGWCYETGGVFNSLFNNMPITQYTHVRAAPGSRQVMGGGSQDNGISITTNGGAAWFFRQGGDGSDLSIDPSNTARMWSQVGVYDPPPVFRRHRTEDSGLTWVDKNAGITAQGNWYTDVDNDRVSPVYLYTNADNKVYRSMDYGDNWTVIGTFPTTVRAVDVGLYTNLPDAAVWAVLESATTGQRVYCWNGATFDQRDAGLPLSVTIRCVIPHPREPNTAFALVNGFASPGHKIFRTVDRGLNWEDVTGNLPNVPLGGIVAHPTDPNQLFVGSEAGSFRAFKSAGRWYWIDWNQGLPKAVIVADMTWADELNTTGKFWVIAGTYGRSMYQREIGDLDVSAVPPEAAGQRPGLLLAQNVPNPARLSGATRITFNLPKPAPVKLRVFDVSGRVVATLADQSLPAGPHEYAFTPEGIVPGVYFYRLEAGAEVLSKKMIVRR